MKISVSILKEKDRLNEVINSLQNTSCDFIHLDIMDSTFTSNTSFSLEELNNIANNKKYDVHIMSTNLDYQINEAIKLNPELITFHLEATKDGLAINPKTRLWKIKKYLNLVDLVLVMSVVPGMGGQKFIPSTIKKIKKLKSKQSGFLISVDGGINNETIRELKEYIDVAVSGSYLTDSDNYEEKIASLKK